MKVITIYINYLKLLIKTNREISTAGGEVIYSFFQKLILQTKFRSKTSSVLKFVTDEVFDRNLICKINF